MGCGPALPKMYAQGAITPPATALTQVALETVSVKVTEPVGRPTLPEGKAMVALNENPARLTVGFTVGVVMLRLGFATPMVIENVCTLPLKLPSPV